ncbi:MAG: hypothetical protein M3Q95_10120 [Bacteroidota bacterium]|nr:hypothetical protein [Bacteroidota bacterium]
MEITEKYYLLRSLRDNSEKKVILQGNNRVELQFIKDVLESELPIEVFKINNYTIEENGNYLK